MKRTAALLMAATLWLCEPASSAAPAPPPTSASEVLKMMQGTWEVVSLEVDGEAVGADQDVTSVVVEKDRLVIKGESRVEPYTFKLDTSARPWRIDLTFDRPDARPSRGILKFEDDKLTIVCGEAGGARPDKFDGKSGTKFVLKKAKGRVVPADGPGQDRDPVDPAESRAKAKELARRVPAKDLTVTLPAGAGGRPSASRPPAALTSAEALAAAFPAEAAEGLKGQVDFTKEKLVAFSWRGRRKEAIGPSRVRTEGKETTIVFAVVLDGGTGTEFRYHLFLYAVPKDAKVEVVTGTAVPK